jgi:transcriptional antiterminator RfaH
MNYWACAQLEANRERLALHCLSLAGFETYLPRIREQRVIRGRRIIATPALFTGYCFVAIELQWHAARFAPGVLRLVLDGTVPAKVPDAALHEIRSRERGDLMELPEAHRLRPGDRVNVLHGPFAGQLALFAQMRPHERVLVLLSLLGGQQRVELGSNSVEATR